MSATRPPRSFWIIASLALVWNLMGFLAFTSQAFISSAALSELPSEQAELLQDTPQWLNGIFAMATITGLLASIFLLLRRKISVILFLFSLVGVLIQMSYSFFATNALEVYGMVQGLIFPIFVILIAIYLYIFSNQARKKGYLYSSS